MSGSREVSDQVVVLAGGVGAARFLQGLVRVVPPQAVTAVVNTGDDADLHGLHICPDIDTVVYHLAGLADEERGWGIKGDTFHALEALGALGRETWFNLGDRDLAMHIHRTEMLRRGLPLSQVTLEITQSLGVKATILPMTDDPVHTIVNTPEGPLEFQEYFVKRRAAVKTLSVEFRGALDAKPAPGVLESIAGAKAIIVAPSNPFISIGPILAIPGVREALKSSPARIAAVSPIVGGHAIKGPAAQMMRDWGLEVSAFQVAYLYQDFLDVFVLDSVDAALGTKVSRLRQKPVAVNTIMSRLEDKVALARATLQALGWKPT